MNYRIAILICSLVLCIGCGHRHDERLQKVAEIVSDKPEEALSRLAGINPDELSRRDRVYYDFLTVKGRDKAFITHTSDSLIKIVLDYAEQHKDAGFYPEVLYYGGRVYSDLGDYPTALRYFQSAIDRLPNADIDIKLKRNIFSETGALYDNIRLYDEAIACLNQSLSISRQIKDCSGIVYDLYLLGHIYLRNSQYNNAENCFMEAFQRSKNLSSSDQSSSAMFLAAVKFKERDMNSALQYIRQALKTMQPESRNMTISYAAKIYKEVGKPDSAYLFANELIHGEDSINRQIGYEVMLSPQVKKLISMDETDKYLEEYRTLLENFLNRHDYLLAIMQQSYFNYQFQEHEKEVAEKLNNRLMFPAIVFFIVLLLLIILVLYNKNKNKARIIELRNAIDCIQRLKRELEIQKKGSPAEFMDSQEVLQASANINSEPAEMQNQSIDTEEIMREHLRKEIYSIYEQSKDLIEVPSMILQSQAYAVLQEYVAQEVCIDEKDIFWKDLENVVMKCSPNFKEYLTLLTSGKLSKDDLHTALLIKCGLQPSQMATVFGRSRSAIVSRRGSLCIKIFDKKMGTKVIDNIIRLL